MNPSPATASVDGTASPAIRRVILLGAASVALYRVVDFSARALFENGLVPRAQLVYSASAPDRAAAAWQLGLYLLATAALFGIYRNLLELSRRGALDHRVTRTCALAVPVLFNLMLLVRAPRVSQDVLSYLAHGYLGQLPGSNPLLHAAREVTETAMGPKLAAYGWDGDVGITPYGVVWTRLEMAVMHATSDVPTGLVLMKAIVMLASFACAACIWSLVGRTAPQSQLTATLAYLWNPLIVTEFAGEGHNDAVMVAFTVATLALVAARRPVAGGVALVLGILTKYLPMLFAPLAIAYVWRTRKSAAGFALALVLSLAIGVAVAAVLYAPIWAGADTFRGLAQRAVPISSLSPFGVINWVLRRSPLRAIAGRLTMLVLTIPLLALVLVQTVRTRDAAGLARSCGWIALVDLLGAAPDYWPWYSCLPVALLLAGYLDTNLRAVVLLSVCARMIAPLNLMSMNGLVGNHAAKALTTGIGASLPLAVIGVWALLSWRQRRAASA